MISFERAQAGLVRYIDTEIIPKLEAGTFKRMAFAAYMGLAADNIVAMLHQYKDHPLVTVTSVIENDEINIERLYGVMAQHFNEPLKIHIPLVDIHMKFTREDLDILYGYMR